MKKVAVITDSNSGITQSEAKKLGIHVVPMPFFVNGDTFYEDISMSQDEFYGYLAQGADVMTSQPAPDTLMKLWDSVLECYDEIVYIPMSSGLSSSCGTAMMLSYEEKYENKVFVVDNQRISVTQRRSVMDAIELAQNGYDGKQIQEILLREKFESSIYIMVDTLSYLKKGGRITPADVMENLSFGLSVDHVLAVTVSGLLGAVWKFVGPEWVFVLGAAVCLVHFGVAVWLGKRAN